VKQLIFARICRSDGEADGGQSYVFYDNTKFCRGQRPDHVAEAVASSGQAASQRWSTNWDGPKSKIGAIRATFQQM
jgi:hypothetical protein